MQSPAGLERVKGLLRSYEDAEVEQAAQQGRREVSYQFLWDALGLAG
jgi:ribosomal protein S6